MATCRAIVTRAYQMAGIVPFGVDPDSTELAAGLGVLQGIYDRVSDGRDYVAIVETGTYEAAENERITGADYVTLPTTITYDGTDRAPKDMAFVQYDIGDGFVTYASDRGTWVRLDSLASSDEAPFSKRNAEGLSALIAMEMAETYPGAAIGPLTMRKAQRFQTIFTREEAQETEYF